MKNLHRRHKQEIARQFTCQAEDCGKSYGAESSLRTHMKQKHPHVKISNSPKKQNRRAGRPIRSEGNVEIDKTDIWSDYNYIKFLETVLNVKPQDWIRGDDDDFSDLDVQEFVQSILDKNKEWAISKKLIQYLRQGKSIFKSEKIGQLYIKIIQELNKEATQDNWMECIRGLNFQESNQES